MSTTSYHAPSPAHARNPPVWLVFGLPWPDGTHGPMAEAAYAIAPSTVPREILPPDIAVVFHLALEFGRDPAYRVVFFSDLSRALAAVGHSWDDVGVDDWEETLETIRTMPILGLYLTISKLAYLHLCDASTTGMTIYTSDGVTENTASQCQREEVRGALQERLAADWPPFVDRVFAEQRVR